MVKWWNHGHSEYLQSYHIEVLALRSLTTSLNDITWDIYKYFLDATTLIQLPLVHEGSSVDVYLSGLDRDEARKRLETARDLARDAWYCTYGGRTDHKAAINRWQQLFGDKFPSYG